MSRGGGPIKENHRSKPSYEPTPEEGTFECGHPSPRKSIGSYEKHEEKPPSIAKTQLVLGKERNTYA
jgi:hypothetical protein